MRLNNKRKNINLRRIVLFLFEIVFFLVGIPKPRSAVDRLHSFDGIGYGALRRLIALKGGWTDRHGVDC